MPPHFVKGSFSQNVESISCTFGHVVSPMFLFQRLQLPTLTVSERKRRPFNPAAVVWEDFKYWMMSKKKKKGFLTILEILFGKKWTRDIMASETVVGRYPISNQRWD